MRDYLFIFLTLTSLASTAQKNALEEKNGFKDILLGSPVQDIDGVKLKRDFLERNEYQAHLYEVDNEAYETIGEIKVKGLELKVYNGLIYEILVTTEKDTRLMKGLVQSYGEPTYILTTDSYNWTAPSLSLLFKNHSRREILLTYRSNPMFVKMKEDKEKKVEEIAEDF